MAWILYLGSSGRAAQGRLRAAGLHNGLDPLSGKLWAGGPGPTTSGWASQWLGSFIWEALGGRPRADYEQLGFTMAWILYLGSSGRAAQGRLRAAGLHNGLDPLSGELWAGGPGPI